MSVPFLIVLIALAVLALWVLPVVLGIREARRKNRSPHWMWTCIYPLLAWIPYLVMRSLPTLKTCPECGEKVNAAARLCRYCHSHFHEDARPGARRE